MSSKIEEIRAARERLAELRAARRESDAARASEVQDEIHDREIESIEREIQNEQAIQDLLAGAGAIEVEEKTQEEKDADILAFAQRAEDAVLDPVAEAVADTGVAANPEVRANTASAPVSRPAATATPASDKKEGE